MTVSAEVPQGRGPAFSGTTKHSFLMALIMVIDSVYAMRSRQDHVAASRIFMALESYKILNKRRKMTEEVRFYRGMRSEFWMRMRSTDRVLSSRKQAGPTAGKRA